MIADMNLAEFINVLSSEEPTPGGGGASALTGAMGVALAGMVASLTLNSDKYKDVHAEMRDIKAQTDSLQARLLNLADVDAAGFAPLAAAYKIPKDDPMRAEILEDALIGACSPPLTIMRVCANAMELFPVLRKKGSKMAVSDVDAGEALCRAAIKAASYNVFINTKLMKDRTKAESMNTVTQRMVEEWGC